MPAGKRPYLTAEDVAFLLGLTPRAARMILEKGELPGFHIGRKWFLRPEDLDMAIDQQLKARQRERQAGVRVLRGLPALPRGEAT